MNTTEPRVYRQTIGGKELILTIGGLAHQAHAAVTCQYGETFVLATVVMSDTTREGVDYMPLLVEYEEKYYAAGKIKGSRFVKREGKPTEEAITTGRMIDRSIRPLFPDRMLNDVQVVTTVLSYDETHQADIPALIAGSAALTFSRVPWHGPLGAVRVGLIDGQFVINPTVKDMPKSALDLIVAATTKEAVMLEADAQELSEDRLQEAIDLATKEAGLIAAFLEKIQQEIGSEKAIPILYEIPNELRTRVRDAATADAEAILEQGGRKKDIEAGFDALTKKVVTSLGLEGKDVDLAQTIVRDLYRERVRERILNGKGRADKRRIDEVRPISAKVGLIPRTHGSALFQRGETQILSTVTLGAPGDAMLLDTMTEEESEKHFMHFYNFPGFSVGEIRPNRGPGRRDIGHGALAERAVKNTLPSREQFGYTVMAVSEVLSSNGSSSMGSACGTSLALMDAGVPISSAVAGIAMGLVTDEAGQGRASVVLTDIAGMEDEGCDMDFKVAGTRNGVTALQVDIKVHGLTREMITDALDGAQAARLHILDVMESVIREPRKELSPYAPKIATMRIKPEKIGDLIGPKGKHINEIIKETGVEIDVEDDGLVTITSRDQTALDEAKEWVEHLTREVLPGEQFTGKVTRLMKFGAFVEILPGTEGLVHISELADRRVNRVEDVVKVGDVIPVIVIEIDEQGRLNLSHKRAKKVQ